MLKSLYLKTYANKEGFEETLALRPTARTIYNQVLTDIDSILPNDIIECIFTGIEMCDVSFSDEFLVNFEKKIFEVDNTLLRIVGANEYVQENIAGALALRNKKDTTKICLLLFTNGFYSILGDIEKNLKDTFLLLNTEQKITARDVAQRFNIEINSASNRLKKLFNLHLVQRIESIDEAGRQHVYYLPK